MRQTRRREAKLGGEDSQRMWHVLKALLSGTVLGWLARLSGWGAVYPRDTRCRPAVGVWVPGVVWTLALLTDRLLSGGLAAFPAAKGPAAKQAAFPQGDRRSKPGGCQHTGVSDASPAIAASDLKFAGT